MRREWTTQIRLTPHSHAAPKGQAGEERRIQVQLSNETQAKNPQSRVLARSGYHLPSS